MVNMFNFHAKRLGDMMQSLKTQGFRGLYFDTSNISIINFACNKFCGTIIKSPLLDRVVAKAYYAQNFILDSKHPIKIWKNQPLGYLWKPVRRVVVKF